MSQQPPDLPGLGAPEYAPAPGTASRARATRFLESRKDIEGQIDELLTSGVLGAVAGTVVSVVKDGELRFEKGYGVANVRTGARPNPESTLFRIGSVSKVVTWTALMQAEERGLLTLDDDVNGLIGDFRIPDTFPEPIRVWNLLTHTGGFEDNQLGLVTREPDPTPLAQVLRRHMPERVSPPATRPSDACRAAYSNYGAALAGHIVAKRREMTFDACVERHIFQPLGMSHSTFEEPVPARLGGDAAVGHAKGPRGFEPQPFEYLHSTAPDGAMSTTAHDMGLFMLAHLGHAREKDFLRPETLDRMHRRSLAAHPAMDGATLGFCEWHLNGRRFLAHAGKTPYFFAILLMAPEEDAGIFMALNTHPSVTPEKLALELANRFFPADATRAIAVPAPSADLVRYEGRFVETPHSHSKIDKALNLVDPGTEISVAATSQGTLVIENVVGEEQTEWAQAADSPGVFHRIDRSNPAQEVIAFLEEGSEVNSLALPMAFAPAYRLKWWQSARFHVGLIGVLSAASGAIVALAAESWGGSNTAAWALMAAVAVLNTACIGIAWGFLEDPYPLLYGFPFLLRAAVLAPERISVPFTLLGAAMGVSAWGAGTLDGVSLLLFWGAVLVNAVYLWVFDYWNLLGERFA